MKGKGKKLIPNVEKLFVLIAMIKNFCISLEYYKNYFIKITKVKSIAKCSKTTFFMSNLTLSIVKIMKKVSVIENCFFI